MKIGVLGSGLGGNNMAVRFVSDGKKGNGEYGYVGLDTNYHTLEDVKEFLNKAEVIEQHLVVLSKRGEDSAEGSGFDPMFAARALYGSLQKIIVAIRQYWVIVCFFAFGKGTGTGTCLTMIRLMLRLGILPFAVISLPPAANPSERRLHSNLIRKVHQLGVRVIVTDSSALRLNPELKKLSPSKGWEVLDEVVLGTLRRGLALILKESSQIDMSDVTRRFLFGQGFLVPVFGEYVRLESEPEKSSEAETNTEKVLKSAWVTATPNYYERGAYMERVIICLTGEWSSEEEDTLEGLVRGYHHIAQDFKPVYARFDTDNLEKRTFAVLYAAAPKNPEDHIRTWVWKRPQSQVSVAVETDKAIAAPVVPQLPSPVVAQVTVEELHREVFRSRTSLTAITFSQFMAATKGVTNQVALKLLASTPAQLVALSGDIISNLGGDPSSFKLGLDEYLLELTALLDREVLSVLSQQFLWDIVEKAMEGGVVFQPELEVRVRGSLTKKRVSAKASDDELDRLIQADIEYEDRDTLRMFKKLRQLLGRFFERLIVQPGQGNGAGGTNGTGKLGRRVLEVVTSLASQIRHAPRPS